MKTFRRILSIIFIIAIAIAAAGFLLPQKVNVKRTLVMRASQGSIFEQINTLKNWTKWSPWLKMDTAIQLTFSGPETGIGASYSWLSTNKNVGRGSLTIIGSVPNDSLLILIDYGTSGKSNGKFILAKDKQSTEVTWCLESDLGMNPISRWFGLFLDHMAGPDLEKGLSNIDKLLAENRMVNEFEIIDYEVPAQIVLSIRDTASLKTLSPKLTSMYNRLSVFLKSRNLSPTGAPMTIFHSFINDKFDIETCFPVESCLAVPDQFTCTEKENQKAVMIQYVGNYKCINQAYSALQTYIANKNLQVIGPPREIYVTDPSVQADSSMRYIDVLYPVNNY
jgi:effector-binding domain-containing protein